MKCLYEGCNEKRECGTEYCEGHYSEYDEQMQPMSRGYEADCEQDREDGFPDLIFILL